MKRLDFRPDARGDLAEARTWYRRHGAAVARRFLDRVDEAFDAVSRSPSAFPKVFRDVRVVLVRGFPYAVYYRDEPAQALVLAVMHTSRDPSAWQSRG